MMMITTFFFSAESIAQLKARQPDITTAKQCHLLVYIPAGPYTEGTVYKLRTLEVNIIF